MSTPAVQSEYKYGFTQYVCDGRRSDSYNVPEIYLPNGYLNRDDPGQTIDTGAIKRFDKRYSNARYLLIDSGTNRLIASIEGDEPEYLKHHGSIVRGVHEDQLQVVDGPAHIKQSPEPFLVSEDTHNPIYDKLRDVLSKLLKTDPTNPPFQPVFNDGNGKIVGTSGVGGLNLEVTEGTVKDPEKISLVPTMPWFTIKHSKKGEPALHRIQAALSSSGIITQLLPSENAATELSITCDRDLMSRLEEAKKVVSTQPARTWTGKNLKQSGPTNIIGG